VTAPAGKVAKPGRAPGHRVDPEGQLIESVTVFFNTYGSWPRTRQLQTHWKDWAAFIMINS
jgi:hypothetical protein